MILTLGSSIRAESQSVETSGSSVEFIFVPIPQWTSVLWLPSPFEAFASLRHLRVTETGRRHPRVSASALIREVRALREPRRMAPVVRLSLRLLRLDLLDRAAGVAP